MKFGKYLNIKITPNKGEINIKANSKFIFILVLLIDSVDNKDKNYYPQVFLGTCKYVAFISHFITNEITNCLCCFLSCSF